MVRSISALALVGMLAAAVAAQSTQYVYFSTRFAETPTSGRGGHQSDLAAPTHPLVMGSGYVNEAAVLNSQGLAVVRPGTPNMTPLAQQACQTPPLCPPPAPMVVDFQEIANIPQFDLEMGDTNGNGLYNDTTNGMNTGTSANFAGIDAVWIPFPPANRAANLHECFLSTFFDSPGTMSYRGTAITEADVFLLPAAPNFYPAPSVPVPPVFFLRQADLETFFGMAPGSGGAIDVDGFCVDQATGDVYVSFDGASATNANPFTGTFLSAPATPVTALVHAGDVFRIPGAAYTPFGAYGVVTSPQPGQVQRVWTQTDVGAMVTNAGGCITNTGSSSTGVLYTNSRGLSIDFTAPGTTITPQGFAVKQLFFTVDNRGTPSSCPNSTPSNLTAAAIYTTQASGAFAVINGTVMNQPSAAGMQDASFNVAFFTGPLDAVCIVELPAPYDPIAGAPFHLDNFPNSYLHLNGATPTPVITGYVAGAAPGATIAILMRADLQSAGGFIDRYSTVPFGIIGGYPDLFIDVIGVNNAGFLMGPALLAPYGQDPFAQSIFNGGPGFVDWNPIVTYSDPHTTPQANNGDSAFSMDLTPLVGAVPFPFVLTFQALDLSQLKLSDAISFEFN
jgi:hypothetical protein